MAQMITHSRIYVAGHGGLAGTGEPRREFLHADDLADACVHLMRVYEGPDVVNVGVGEDISIHSLASLIRTIVGYTGGIVYDTARPEGTPRRLLDASRLRGAGGCPKIDLDQGIAQTYQWLCEEGLRHGVRQ